MKYASLVIMMLLLTAAVHAQTASVTVRGNVMAATNKENLSGATVQLYRLTDSIVIRKTLSQRNGFVLNRVPAGEYELLVSFVGYRDTAYRFMVSAKDSLVRLDTLWLFPKSSEMMEVVVRSVIPPVIVKSDTVVYNTSAFKTQPNATVEELLKKLPGMEVDKDGNITFQGEKVQKIYVDGKEFFLNDPKLASQNLLADMVQKVEAFDSKSDRARLTGIPDNSPGKSINLRLKPDKKKGLFGNAQAGYASKDRYGIRATANYFKRDTYIMLVGNSSNGGNILGGSGGVLNNRVNNIALNYSNRWNEKLTLAGSYSLNDNSSRNQVINHRQTFLGDSSLLEDRLSRSAGSGTNHAFNVSMNYAIDSFNLLTAGTSLAVSSGENMNANDASTAIQKLSGVVPANKAYTLNKTKTNGWNGNMNLQYSHRFRKAGRYFGIGLSNNYSNSDGRGELASRTDFYTDGLVVDSLIRNQRSMQDNRGSGMSVSVNYTEPIAKGQVLDVGYTLSRGRNKANQQTLNYNPLTGKYDERDSLASNAFDNRNNTQQFSLGYNYFKEKLRYQLGMSVSKSFQDNQSLSGNYESIRQDATNIYPRASVQYNISKQQYFQLSYNGSNRQPSIEQLQPVPDYSNPLLIRLGNPDLKQEFTNSVSVNYRSFNAGKTSSFMWQADFRNTANQIVNATRTTAQGVQEQQYVNVNGNFNVGTNINYALPIGKGNSKGSVNLSTRLQYGEDVSFLNGVRNERKNFTGGQQVRVSYHAGEIFFVNVNGSVNWNRSVYSLPGSATGSFLSQAYSTDLSYRIAGWVVESQFHLSLQGSRNNLPSQTATVWNASVLKDVLKNRTGQLKFSVYDILNNANSFRQSAGDNYIETTETEVLQRVFVLSFVYRFRVNGI